MERIGIFGGTFDPPHIGHLILAETAVDALSLDRMLFVPAGDPPHKQFEEKTPIEYRLAMLTLAIADNPHFALSRVDVDRPGPHFSLDMVTLIQAQQPAAELFFVMGGDSLHDLPRWYHPELLIQRCKLAVVRRSGDQVQPGLHEDVLPGLWERVLLVDAPLIEISSTDVVERLLAGRSVRYLLPDTVLDFIYRHHLYRTR
jgi:nicotinate-nucleotide adenylyltransferase